MGKKERKMVLLLAQRRSDLFRHTVKHCFDMEQEFGKAKKRPIERRGLREEFDYI